MNAKEYVTSSLPLATFLVYSGVQLIEIRNDPKQKNKMFVFENSERLQNLVNLYFSRKAEVEPETFYLTMKVLKSRLYDFGR
jgi:hypothetical protein